MADNKMDRTLYLSKLRDLLTKHFSLNELETLCFDIGVSYDDLAGQTLTDKSRSIIAYLSRRDKLNDLIVICKRERPSVQWQQSPSISETNLDDQEKPKSQSGRSLRIVLCAAPSDEDASRVIYERLKAEGFELWFEPENILPGQNPTFERTKALGSSDLIIACVSQVTEKQSGPFHGTVKAALTLAQSHPEGAVFVVPIKLQACDLPQNLSSYEAVAYYTSSGYDRLLRTLRARAASLALRPTDDMGA